jgi:hypothetical protein
MQLSCSTHLDYQLALHHILCSLHASILHLEVHDLWLLKEKYFKPIKFPKSHSVSRAILSAFTPSPSLAVDLSMATQ